MRRLLVFNDGTGERTIELRRRVLVGRDPACDISLDDTFLSRRHAEFFLAGDAVTVRDLGSRNGLYVNGTRAVERVLAQGDIVQIGPIFANVVIDRSRPVPALPPADDTVTLLDVPPRLAAKVIRPAAPAPILVEEIPRPSQSSGRVRHRVHRGERHPHGVFGKMTRLFGGAAAMTASYFAFRSMRRRSGHR